MPLWREWSGDKIKYTYALIAMYVVIGKGKGIVDLRWIVVTQVPACA